MPCLLQPWINKMEVQICANKYRRTSNYIIMKEVPPGRGYQNDIRDVALPVSTNTFTNTDIGRERSLVECIEASGAKLNTAVRDPWKELASQNGPLPPLAQRLCHPGFICAYGTCSKQKKDVLECFCDPRFTDKFCQTPCPLVCDNHRHCEFNSQNKTPECYCDYGYAGPNCTEAIGQQNAEPMSTEAAASLAAALILLLLLLFVLLPLLLYRKRNITMMKIVNWFHGFEDDKKDFDAFVSYVSADQDRQFVIQTVVPKLEGRMCFTLCIHQRNLAPGVYTANNAEELVRRSRRVIIILSLAYINSEWDKHEYHTMLQEMIKEKRHIILILLGDISVVKGKIDDTLTNMLKSATVLKYPGKNATQQEYDTFWKRLELSMPKKRPTPLESGKGQSCLMSPSISASLDSSQDPKAPVEIRQFTNGNLNTQLLQRIVRVPASKLESNERNSALACPAFDRILGRSHGSDLDSQDGNLGVSAADDYHRLRQSEPSLAGDVHEGIVNNGFNYSETGHVNGDHQGGPGRFPNSHDGSWTTAANNEFFTGQEVPVSLPENYLRL